MTLQASRSHFAFVESPAVSYDDGLSGFDHAELRQTLQDLADRLFAQRSALPSSASVFAAAALLLLALLGARQFTACQGNGQSKRT